MSDIRVLDCTLRDGGYCNQWAFGYKNVKNIINRLYEAWIDIIECGFLTDRVSYTQGVTKFTTMEQIAEILPKSRGDKLFVCMVNYGEYAIESLPDRKDGFVDGIRVAFHKKNANEAMEYCRRVKEKGYKVFVQPMMTMNYSETEFSSLIQLANEIRPYAFYIVDSFGVMKRRDLLRFFGQVEMELSKDVCIGYHSHNNMQLAYSNAQAFADSKSEHRKIIDSSVFGMGRGAGNLNTELFVEYLNDNFDSEYNLKPLLIIIDEILNDFYEQSYWGYSLPNYLSAKHKAHPNYAGYLDAKKTLTVECMDEIFSMMSEGKKSDFDKKYVEDLYIRYMASGKAQENHLVDLKELLKGKGVLLIAPGKSSIEEKERVIACAKQEDVLTISVNFEFKEYDTDFIFLSNLRRFREMSPEKYSKCIVTSNIPMAEAYLKVKYEELLNETEAVRDNSGMMLIAYLIQLGVKKIYLAGIDGYSVDPTQNFVDQKMNFYTKKVNFEAMNEGIKTVLNAYKKSVDIEFVTTPKHVTLLN